MEDKTGAVWLPNQPRSDKHRSFNPESHSSSNTNTPRFAPPIHAYLDVTSRFKLHCSSDGFLTLLTTKISVSDGRESVSALTIVSMKSSPAVFTPHPPPEPLGFVLGIDLSVG